MSTFFTNTTNKVKCCTSYIIPHVILVYNILFCRHPNDGTVKTVSLCTIVIQQRSVILQREQIATFAAYLFREELLKTLPIER